MAITKTGNSLLGKVWNGAKSGAKAVGHGLSTAGSFAMRYGFPMMTTTLMANDIMSGQSSVGKAIGENVGSMVGFYGLQKGISALGKRFKITPWISTPLSWIVPMIGSFQAADVGGKLGHKIIPYQRTPVYSDYFKYNMPVNNNNI